MPGKLCLFCTKFVNRPLCEITRRDGHQWSQDNPTKYFLLCLQDNEEQSGRYGDIVPDIDDIMQYVSRANDVVSCNTGQHGRALIYNSIKQASIGRLGGCHLCEAMYESLESSLVFEDLYSVALLEVTYQKRTKGTQIKGGPKYDEITSLIIRVVHLKHKTRSDGQRQSANVSFQRNFNHFIGNSKFVQYQKEKSFETCRKWLDMCVKRHTCGTAISSDISKPQRHPTRLLQIKQPQPDSKPRLNLVQTSQLKTNKIRYATLSYCWGYKSHPGKLMECNYNRFSRRVSFATLPKTVRQAIEVTLGLGLEYLWVDTLCIIQDSDEDWASESANMAAIYSLGMVNIAATAAHNCSEGLFVQDIMETQQLTILGWSILPKDRNLWCLDGDDDGVGLYRESISRAPLFKRAWVFQEVALAPRTIHFAKNFLLWGCRQATIEEDGTRLTAPHQPLNQFLYLDWEDLVERYAPTRLTFPGDRLIAFAGIAEVYAHRHKYNSDDYAAGLWRNKLPSQLLWWVHGRWERSQAHTYVAPTWSWASVSRESNDEQFDQITTMKFAVQVFGQLETHKAVRILKLSIGLQSRISPYGKISRGSLDMECFVHNTIYRPAEATLEIKNDPLSRRRGMRERFSVYIDYNKTDGELGDISGYFAPISRDNHGGIWGLLLKLINKEKSLFQRIGVARSGKHERDPWWWTRNGRGFRSQHVITTSPGGKSVTTSKICVV